MYDSTKIIAHYTDCNGASFVMVDKKNNLITIKTINETYHIIESSFQLNPIIKATLRKFPTCYDPYLNYYGITPFLDTSVDLIDRERDL